MTIAYWIVFVLMFVPLGCAVYAKVTSGFSMQDNHHPREFMQQLTGAAARANAAQINSYEIYPVFVAAVIIAHLTGNASQSTIDLLAVLFLGSRLLFCYCYIKDYARWRSWVWFIGLICIAGLFVAAA